MKNFLLYSTILTLIVGCEKDKVYQPFVIPCQLTQDLSLSRTYIKGVWEWVEEHRYERGSGERYLTPKSEGFTRIMVIGDSTLQLLKNNQVVVDYKYKIEFRGHYTGTNFPEDSLPALIYYRISDGGKDGHVPIKICDKYLVLQNQYVSSITGQEIWRKL